MDNAIIITRSKGINLGLPKALVSSGYRTHALTTDPKTIPFGHKLFHVHSLEESNPFQILDSIFKDFGSVGVLVFDFYEENENELSMDLADIQRYMNDLSVQSTGVLRYLSSDLIQESGSIILFSNKNPNHPALHSGIQALDAFASKVFQHAQGSGLAYSKISVDWKSHAPLSTEVVQESLETLLRNRGHHIISTLTLSPQNLDPSAPLTQNLLKRSGPSLADVELPHPDNYKEEPEPILIKPVVQAKPQKRKPAPAKKKTAKKKVATRKDPSPKPKETPKKKPTPKKKVAKKTPQKEPKKSQERPEMPIIQKPPKKKVIRGRRKKPEEDKKD